MNRTQQTILTLILVSTGIHLWLDPAARTRFKEFLTITPNNWQMVGADVLSGWLLYFLSLAALLLLSDYAPRMATWIAWMILLGAVLINYKPITGFLDTAVKSLAKGAAGPALPTDKTASAGGPTHG